MQSRRANASAVSLAERNNNSSADLRRTKIAFCRLAGVALPAAAAAGRADVKYYFSAALHRRRGREILYKLQIENLAEQFPSRALGASAVPSCAPSYLLTYMPSTFPPPLPLFFNRAHESTKSKWRIVFTQAAATADS